MIVSIHQPNYLPWLGYFHKIYTCDLFVFLDNVLYGKGTVNNRNKIKTPHGWKWLTVPLRSHGILRKKINEVEISNETDWGKKHFKTLERHYQKAAYFEEYKPFFEKLYAVKWEKMAELNEEIINYLVRQFGIEKRFVKASDLDVQGSHVELLINICKKLSADTCLTGIGSKAYIDEKKFVDEGIKLVYQNFQHPNYKQLFGEFIPNMSAVDLLFNYGPKSLDIMLGKSQLDLGRALQY